MANDTAQFEDVSRNVPEADVYMASIAISLKRIADAMTQSDDYGFTGSASISQAIKDGMRERG